MGFKLIRLDSEDPAKIPLSVGTHVIGRGSFLNCDDRRVSRQHGVIKVTEDTVLIKSLHPNPCFYNKLKLHKTVVLPRGKWVSLNNTDHFGLLQDTYWYELIFCNDNISSTNSKEIGQENITNTTENIGTVTRYKDRSILRTEVTTRTINKEVNLDTQQYSINTEFDGNSDSESFNLEFDDIMEDCIAPESQSLLTSDNIVPGDPNEQTNGNQTVCRIQTTPGKRSHTPEPSTHAKKIKTEPESPKNTENYEDPPTEEPNSTDEAHTEPHGSLSSMEINTEPKGKNVKKEPPNPDDVKKQPDVNNPGPSHHQQGTSNDDCSTAAKPLPAAKERCIYGAYCYRKNPHHSLQFSHPSDADYRARPRDPNTTPPLNEQTNGTQTTPGKRSHTPEPSADAQKIKTEPESPKNTENHENTTTEEPKSIKEANTNMNSEAQNLVDVDMDSQSSMNVITDANNAGNVKTEPQSPSNAVNVKDEPQSPDTANNVKKEPPSPNVVKKEPDANNSGPSRDQQRSSNALATPPPRARERCMYGANCYRRNIQHKLQFSHPGDADYGAGARGACPYGAACRRADPRHWAAHTHPRHTRQPLGMRMVHGSSNQVYRNNIEEEYEDVEYEEDEEYEEDAEYEENEEYEEDEGYEEFEDDEEEL